MEWTASRVHVAALPQIGQVLDLVSEEVARLLNVFAANDHNLVAVQNLLGNHGCQSAEQVAAAINNNGLERER